MELENIYTTFSTQKLFTGAAVDDLSSVRTIPVYF